MNSLFFLVIGQWILSLQDCGPEYSSYTIKGLWPPGEYCYGKPYNNETLNPLQKSLDKWWPSCQRYSHHPNEWLWRHEWEKHGICANMTQFEYFSHALMLARKYSGLCPEFIPVKNCELCFSYDNNKFVIETCHSVNIN